MAVRGHPLARVFDLGSCLLRDKWGFSLFGLFWLGALGDSKRITLKLDEMGGQLLGYYPHIGTALAVGEPIGGPDGPRELINQLLEDFLLQRRLGEMGWNPESGALTQM